MGLFSFDEKYPFFDVTPVDNLFIQEYLPAAKPEYIKVYLYGLMLTYHKRDELNLPVFAHELGMSENETENAFRYWERRGLIHKTSGNPPSYRYMSAKQVLMNGRACVDEVFENFAIKLNSLFGASRKLHGGETQLAFEWVEELHLPEDVVLALIQYLIDTRGAHFSFQAAQKQAVELASEKINAADDAVYLLSRKKSIYAGAKNILAHLGKRRAPSEDEMKLYEKWAHEYGFAEDAIIEACREMTKGDPSFAYLDGILSRLHKQAGENGQPLNTRNRMKENLDNQERRAAPLREINSALGSRTPITDGTIALYEQMAALTTHDIILIAADQCAKANKKLTDVLELVTYWSGKGLDTSEKVKDYMALIHYQNGMLKELYAIWGKQAQPSATDRTALTRWMDQYGFSETCIRLVASHAAYAERPTAYMEKILKDLDAKAIKTPEGIQTALSAYHVLRKAADSGLKERRLSHQNYDQRQDHEDDLSELKGYAKEGGA